MFHLQATCQQTLVFTPMLIKVNYFVVWGHWHKTVVFLVYVMYKSSKFQDASNTNWWLTYVFLWDSKHFFSSCLNYFCFARPNVSWLLGDSFSFFFHPLTFMGAKHFFFPSSSWDIPSTASYLRRKVILENSGKLSSQPTVHQQRFPESWNLTNPPLQFIFIS